MVKRKFVINDPRGLHLRPAGIFCEEAIRFRSSIQILIRSTKANGKSVLSVLGAGIKYGDEIEIVCEGEDEDQALESLTKVIEQMEKNNLE